MENRQEFMDFFRDDKKLDLLTPDDRVEIFISVLMGSSDLTAKLLNEVINNYSAGDDVVVYSLKAQEEVCRSEAAGLFAAIRKQHPDYDTDKVYNEAVDRSTETATANTPNFRHFLGIVSECNDELQQEMVDLD